MADTTNPINPSAPANQVKPDAVPGFTAIGLNELPARVRTSNISDADKAVAAAVAVILASGQAARSSEIFDVKRKATDAGVKLRGVMDRLATLDTTFPYHGKTSVRTLQLTPETFTFAIVPKADETPDGTTAETGQGTDATPPANADK